MEGSWIWNWKDYIDRKFMKMYSDLPEMEDMMSRMNFKRTTHINEFVEKKGVGVLEAFTSDPMRCGGCGAKVGSTTVSRVLATIHERQVARAASLGLPEPPPSPIEHDDAALIAYPNYEGEAMLYSIDYFRELVADPYIFGKIVAVHALSDIHAMGAMPQSALTLAVAPFAADESVTESTLLHMLSGVSDVLQDENVRLIGGHTCEGQELAC